eukprot:gene11960-5361_t
MTKDEFTIERLRIDDCETVHDIIKQTGEHMFKMNGYTNWKPPPVTLEYLKQNFEKFFLFGIFNKEKKMIGTFSLQHQPLQYKTNIEWSEKDSNNFLFIKRLAVIPEYQRRGLGKLCLDFVENEFSGVYIRLDTYYKNENSIKFYEKMGYKNLGVTQQNEFGGISVICFEKLAKKNSKL